MAWVPRSDASGVTTEDEQKRRNYITEDPDEYHSYRMGCIAFAFLVLVGGSLMVVFFARTPSPSTAAPVVSPPPSLQPSKTQPIDAPTGKDLFYRFSSGDLQTHLSLIH
jgi:hypothetical protein